MALAAVLPAQSPIHPNSLNLHTLKALSGRKPVLPLTAGGQGPQQPTRGTRLDRLDKAVVEPRPLGAPPAPQLGHVTRPPGHAGAGRGTSASARRETVPSLVCLPAQTPPHRPTRH